MNSLNKIEELFEKFKNHNAVAFCIVFGTTIIGLAAFTEAFDKLASKGHSVLVTLTAPFKQADLSSVLGKISASRDSEFQDAYKELREYLILNQVQEKQFKQPMHFDQPLLVRESNGTTVISTVNQYKISGFAIFIDTQSGKVVLSDSNFPLGIKSIKLLDNTEGYPKSMVLIKYITATGTGMYGESIRFYVLDAGKAHLALDKPYSEVSSGWGAFKNDSVEFRTRNDIKLNKKMVEIHSTGIVTIGEDAKQFKKLPEEIYLWEPRSQEFELIKGRNSATQSLMSSVYSDLANPNGNWFKKPPSIDKTSLRKIFIEEDW